MARTVESEAYKLPDGYITLAQSWRFKDDVTRPGNFNDLPQLATELGFLKIANFPTKRSFWQVYDRPNHDVPNFPDGTTRISSTLAVYGKEEELTHAILRTSPEPYPTEDFAKDLASFTKHYIERPRLLGFPSQELVRPGHVFTALAVGVVTLSAADYYLVQSMSGSVVNLGSVIGEIGGSTAYVTLWALSERHARKSISHPEQYTTSNGAESTLLEERHHTVNVAIQKELYLELEREGVSLTPDQFLEKIYRQMPQALIDKRHTEVEQAKYPRLDIPREVQNSLPKLIAVSHILQAA